MADLRTPSDDRLDDATITRYLNGTCSPAELGKVQRWLEADPAHRAELAALQAAWNPPPVAETDPEDRMWRWVAARMDEPVARPTALRSQEGAYPYLRRFGLIAAALLLFAGGALLYRLPGRVSSSDTLAPLANAARGELVTPRGARATGNLPDGSRVILGPDSRLRIPTTFAATPSAGGARDVYLQGEAFFEVTHDSTRPFRVHTANGIVEDLGTEFAVTAYPEAGATRAVVVSGIVALRSGRATTSRDVVLRAGDLGRLDTAGAAILARNVDLAAYVGWTEGNLVFEQVPLREAIATLGRWYDLNIQLADTALARRRFTATFNDEPVSQVFHVLEIALDVHVKRTGQQVVLRPRSSAPAPRR